MKSKENPKVDEKTFNEILMDWKCELVKDYDFTKEQIRTLIDGGRCYEEIIEKQFLDVTELVRDPIYNNWNFCQQIGYQIQQGKIANDNIIKVSLETGICTQQIFGHSIDISNDVARHAIDLLDKGSTWTKHLNGLSRWEKLPPEDITRLLQILKRREREDERTRYSFSILLNRVSNSFTPNHIESVFSLNLDISPHVINSFLKSVPVLKKEHVNAIIEKMSTSPYEYEDSVHVLIRQHSLLKEESLKLFIEKLPSYVVDLSKVMEFSPFLVNVIIERISQFNPADPFEERRIRWLLDAFNHQQDKVSGEQIRKLYDQYSRDSYIINMLIKTQVIPEDVVDKILRSESFAKGNFMLLLSEQSLTHDQITFVIRRFPLYLPNLAYGKKNYLSEEQVAMMVEERAVLPSTLIDIFARPRQEITSKMVSSILKSHLATSSVLNKLKDVITKEHVDNYLKWSEEQFDKNLPFLPRDVIFKMHDLPDWFIEKYLQRIKERDERLEFSEKMHFLKHQYIPLGQVLNLIAAEDDMMSMKDPLKLFLESNIHITDAYVEIMLEEKPKITQLFETYPNYYAALVRNHKFFPGKRLVDKLIEQEIGLHDLIRNATPSTLQSFHVDKLIEKKNEEICQILMKEGDRLGLNVEQKSKCLLIMHGEELDDEFFERYVKGRDVWQYIPADTFSDAVEAFLRAIRQSEQESSPIKRLVNKYENVVLEPPRKEMSKSLYYKLQVLAGEGKYRAYADNWDYLYTKDEQGRERKRAIGKYLAALANKGNVEAQEVLKEYKEAKKLMASKTIKATVVISNDPVDIMGKTTGKGWSSCEHVDNSSAYGSPVSWLDSDFESGNKGCGWCDDIAYNNLIAYFIPEGEERWGGRTMIRWCYDNDSESVDIGFSQYYGRDVYEDSFFKFLEGKLKEQGYLAYDSCTTPYEYSGFAGYSGSGTKYSVHSSMEYSEGREISSEELKRLVENRMDEERIRFEDDVKYYERSIFLAEKKMEETTDEKALEGLRDDIEHYNDGMGSARRRLEELEFSYRSEEIEDEERESFKEASLAPRITFYID